MASAPRVAITRKLTTTAVQPLPFSARPALPVLGGVITPPPGDTVGGGAVVAVALAPQFTVTVVWPDALPEVAVIVAVPPWFAGAVKKTKAEPLASVVWPEDGLTEPMLAAMTTGVPEATGSPDASRTWIVTMLVPEQDTEAGEAFVVTVAAGPTVVVTVPVVVGVGVAVPASGHSTLTTKFAVES
jgi:hypothetical protein